MVDHAALLTELRGRVAEKPAWGRQELLVLMAELEVKHSVAEDEFDRALRLTMPQMLDLLFNRAPQLAEAVRSVGSGGVHASRGDDVDRQRDVLDARSSMAAV